MRSYYTDPYTVNFEAAVLELFQREGKSVVVLDKSFFYPTSGGQEHDTGFINGVAVVDVVEENDNILHILAGEIPKGKVNCEIDWKRRFGNMQQHTGQHILSASFENLFDIQTVSSRLGESVGTIDLSRQPTSEELEAAVAQANKIVQENREVVIHFADQSNVNSFKLRKPPKVEGTVRIIEVKDFDFSPCGGTHCTHTSEIGVILTGNIEKIKGSLTRIEFYCGNRAIAYYYRLHHSARESARLLSTFPEEMSIAIERMKNQLQEKDGKIKELSERILKSVCENLKPKLEQSSESFKVVDLNDDVASAEELRFVASSLAREVKTSFAFHRSEGNICQMNLNLMVDDKQASNILIELRNDFNAKGGGRNGFYSLSFGNSYLANVLELLKKKFQNV